MSLSLRGRVQWTQRTDQLLLHVAHETPSSRTQSGSELQAGAGTSRLSSRWTTIERLATSVGSKTFSDAVAGRPSHRGLREHLQPRPPGPAAPHQREAVGRVGADRRRVSVTSSQTKLRPWGSLRADVVVLVVFRGEEFPENILQATASLKTVNIIPAIGETFLRLRCFVGEKSLLRTGERHFLSYVSPNIPTCGHLVRII